MNLPPISGMNDVLWPTQVRQSFKTFKELQHTGSQPQGNPLLGEYP